MDNYINSTENNGIDLFAQINEIKKYLKKLNRTISNEASLNLGACRFVSKKRIDDIICCVEASWPQELKNIAQNKFNEELNSLIIYKDILSNITNKTFFSSNHYFVNYDQFLNKSNLLVKTLTKEVNSTIQNR